jgi:DmsE family decaheme c-type cytochrome
MGTRPVLLLATAVGLALFWAGTPVSASEQEAAPGYVGTETCLTCHEGKDEEMADTQHGKVAFSDLSEHGCETCHGPGEKHVEDPEAWQPRVADRSAKEQTEVCQSCHAGAQQFFWDGGRHETRGLSCLSCHSIHAPASDKGGLKAASVQEQCFTCHKEIRAETLKTSHHPIREGEIGCTDCHNPHGTGTESLIAAASINDQCYSCHTEKRGPFLWEHAPVRESCLTCHSAHGSNHLKLQKTSVPYLCQQCHSNTRHPGTLYDRTSLADGTRPTNREFSRACLNCHPAIHGSNHPSGAYLGR